MPLIFPTSASLNQTYQSGSSATYTWNGTYWQTSLPPTQTVLSATTAATAISSSFANTSLSATTASFATTTTRKQYIMAYRATSNQTSVAAGTVLLFNSASASNGITLNTSTGVFTLTAGRTYAMSAGLEFQNFSNTTGGYITYIWANNATNAGLPGAISGNSVPLAFTGNTSVNYVPYVIYTPTTNEEIKLRVWNSDGTAALRYDFSWVSIIEL
jgi:hypothetical protein